MFGIVYVPLESPKLLYLRHYGTTSWAECRLPYADRVSRTIGLVPTLSYPRLRSLASYTVFLITYSLSAYTLSSGTLYQHYVRAVKSTIVPADRLIPRSFPKFSCTFVRVRGCCTSKRFHKVCVTPSEFYWYTHTEESCASKDETIARLYTDSNEWWCNLCNKPFFATADCLFC